MNRIGKALARFTPKERERIRAILTRILRRDFFGLDRQKLKDREDIFRVRKGNFRILYRIDERGEVYILRIERRSEKTYR